MNTKQKIALARIAHRIVRFGRGALGRPNHVVVRRGGIWWELDLDEGIDFSIYLLGMFERRTVETCIELLRKGDQIVDIGANIGAYTLPLARHVGPKGRVLAVEPTNFAFSKLVKNITHNSDLIESISPVQALLTDNIEPPSVQGVYSSWPLTGKNSDSAKHGGRIMTIEGAQSIRLDALLAEYGMDKPDLVKMDVDGNECKVLRGAQRMLGHARPPIVMELAPYTLEEAGDSLEELLDILHVNKYRLLTLGGVPLPCSNERLVEMVPAGSSMNVLARPM